MRLFIGFAMTTGLYLVFNSILANSKHSLLARMRLQERATLPVADRLQAFRRFLRSTFASRTKLRSAVLELPDVLELMAASLAAGDGLFAALARVVPRASGVLGDSLRKVMASIELGADLESELEWLASKLPQRQIIEFSTKLSQAHRRGAPLAQMLKNLADSTRTELRNDLLKQAGRNETRMLIPLVFLILPVTVLFAVYPSLQLLNIDYI